MGKSMTLKAYINDLVRVSNENLKRFWYEDLGQPITAVWNCIAGSLDKKIFQIESIMYIIPLTSFPHLSKLSFKKDTKNIGEVSNDSDAHHMHLPSNSSQA